MRKKLFIGLNNISRVGLALKEGFEKLGWKVDFYSSEKTMHMYNYFNNDYQSVKRIQYSGNKFINYLQIFVFILKLIFKYDYFIFLQGSEGYLLSGYKDIRILKWLGKKIAVIFAGCDVRVPELVNKYKWNPCVQCTESYQKFVGCRFPDKYKKLKSLKQHFDNIFSPDECAGYFNNQYYPFFYPVKDIKSLYATSRKLIKNQKNKILIVHAPTNELYKGSEYIYKAVNAVKKKYDVELVKLQNLSRQELYQKILECDLLIDQMLGGFYGVLAVETMYLEIPVVCYIREDIWEKIKDICPIYAANPDNLEETLIRILNNPQELIERGKKSREYALKYHSPEKVASYMIEKIKSNKN